MTLLRQGVTYLAAGIGQLLLDWTVFVVASACGVPPGIANVCGRVSGALLGFWLNGRFTFRDGRGARLGWPRFLRFLPMWLLLTAISTVLVASIAARLGLQQAWLAKPVVEGALAVVAFFLWRHLVYR